MAKFKCRPALRVLVSASEAGEREWNRHRDVLWEIGALKAWGLPVSQCVELKRRENLYHSAQVRANYEIYKHTVVERQAKRQQSRRLRDLNAADPYFGYREERRKGIMQAREALAAGKIGLDTYNRVVEELRRYCVAMIAHDKRVNALKANPPTKTRIHLRRVKSS